MKNLMLLVAVGCLALVLTAPAQAQYFPGSGHSHGGYNPGYGGGFNPGYGGYNPGYGGFNPGYGRGHIDYVPGGFVPHRNHFHYVPPHTDYHIGGRRYEVQPGPFGPSVSPFPHYYR